MVAGSGTAPNVSGLLTTLSAPDDPGTASGWDDVVSLVTGQVDGRYALGAGDVRLLLAADSYKFASVTRPAAGPHETAVDYLAERTGGVQVTPAHSDGLVDNRASSNGAVYHFGRCRSDVGGRFHHRGSVHWRGVGKSRVHSARAMGVHCAKVGRFLAPKIKDRVIASATIAIPFR